MTAGNFVFRAKASNRYEKIISNGKTNKMIRVFMDLNLILNYKNWEGV
jgi:plasmid maintenance system killer protein